jgi:hypothetical protein
MLKQSIYVRVPSGIADLIGIDSSTELTLNLVQQEERFVLIYSMARPPISKAYSDVDVLESYDEQASGQLSPLPRAHHSPHVER